VAIVDTPRDAALLEGHPALAIVLPPGVPSEEQDEQIVLARRMVRMHEFGHAGKPAAGLRREGRPVLVISTCGKPRSRARFRACRELSMRLRRALWDR
jgi:hypothetical protein